jgi:uncharacterized protein (DUF1501 family)
MNRNQLNRRTFLGASAAAAGGAMAADMTVLDMLQSPAAAAELKRKQKSVILLWLAGGASQLETFDPKPGRPTGGPYRAIPTSVPGTHISELMPKMATRMKHTAIIRSLNTKIADHGGGADLMSLGRRDEPSLRYPDLGAIVARELGSADSAVPDYVSFYAQTEGRGSAVGQAGFLGSRYLPMFLTNKSKPDNLERLATLSDLDHSQRSELRDHLSKRFARGRETSAVGSHNQAYARVRGLMASEKLFDVMQEPEKVRDRYGKTQFGEQAVVARRLVEAGVPFVKLGRAWWDSHGDNFETHLELVADLDHVMSTLLDDLSERGLLENTLIVTLSEFGRTPRINSSLGRDHFASAWSTTLSGCGIKGGAVYGKTDDDGNKVADGEISAPELFATIFEAVGIDPTKEYHAGPRPVPMVDKFAGAVKEVLA